MITPTRWAAWLLLFILCVFSSPLLAEEKSLEEQTEEWRSVLTAARAELAHDFADRVPSEVMSELRTLQREAQSARRSAQSRLDEVRRTLNRLGPAPEDGEPPEAETLRDARQELQEVEANHAGWVRIAGAVEERTNDLLEDIARWEQERFRRQLTQRLPNPTEFDIWRQAGEDGLTFAVRLVEAPVDWWREHRREEDARSVVAWLVFLSVLGLLVGWPLRKMVLRRFGRDPDDTAPSYARRIVAAVADGVGNSVVPGAIIGLVVLVMTLQGLLSGLMLTMVYVSTASLAGYLVLFGLSRAALSPYQVAWRIVPVNPARVMVLLGAIRLAALAIVVGSALLLLMLYTESNTLALESVFLLLHTVVVGIAVAWVLSPRYWVTSLQVSQEAGTVEEAADSDASEADEPPEEDKRPVLDVLRGLLRFVVVLAPFIALIGYSRLAHFIQSRLLATAIVIGLGLLLRLAVRELVQQFYLSRAARGGGPMATHRQRPSEATLQGTIFWTGFVTDLLIFIPMSYVLLLLYGVPPATLALWTQSLFSGIEIGGFTLAPGNLLIAILMLSAGLVATNLVRRWLTTRVLPNTRLEIGARNSIAAGTGYVGVGIAILVAMGALGLDFTNLALVVGALSLGIGFGLRNVVENFVAGILLLIERPIKVGDWIIVNNHEGTVRHISVRSTEIETFDRAAVIVPNADLVSSSVINWTHTNRMARERIRVRVAYGSDTEQVAQILLRCAKEHRKVLAAPPPLALFVGFGDSSLDFELRCFIGDTDDFMTVLSELHFAVERALREAGIVIPFPQRDLHIHRAAHLEKAQDEDYDSGSEQEERAGLSSQARGPAPMPYSASCAGSPRSGPPPVDG